VDAGRVGERWFLSVLSSGFDSLVTERAERMTWLRGAARYNMAIAAQLRVLRPIPYLLTLAGERLQTDAMLVAVGNGQSYGGGMRVCPSADIADGLLDVTILRPLPTAAFVRLFPSVYRGTHVRHPAVLTRRARTVTLAAQGMNGIRRRRAGGAVAAHRAGRDRGRDRLCALAEWLHAFHDPAHEGGLTRVLQVVGDDADQPHAQRDGRLPGRVHDSVEIIVAQAADEADGLLVHGVVIADQQLRLHPHRGHLLGGVPEAGRARAKRQPEPLAPAV
jgi:hypothetical protein